MKKYVFLFAVLIVYACGESTKEKIIGGWETIYPEAHVIEFLKDGNGIIHYPNGNTKQIHYSFIGNDEIEINNDSLIVSISFSDDYKILFLDDKSSNQKRKYTLVSNIEEIKVDWELNKGLNIITSIAQQYYRKPKDFGGGGSSFEGFEIFPQLKEQKYSKFDFKKISDTMVVIIGEAIKDSTKKVEATVTPFRIISASYQGE